MRKLSIGILLATLISAFIIVYLSNYTTSFNTIILNWKDMGEILEKWIAILGIVAIPFVLYFLGQQEQQRKEDRDRKDDQQIKQRQDEQARINRLKEYILQRILPVLKDMSHTIISIEERNLPLENANKKENFVLIINNMMSYTDMITKFVAHFNKMSPDVKDQDIVLHHYCFNRLTEITNTTRLIMSNFDLINKMYYEYKTLVPALRRTLDMSEALFDFFESTVIYGLGETSREDSLEFLNTLYKKFLKDIEKDTKGKIRFESI